MKVKCLGEIGEEKEFLVKSVDKITISPKNVNMAMLDVTTKSGGKMSISAKVTTLKIS